ncbi:unnamed protein product [Sphenostylis stenocarpa]|uniref:Ultraviolet-B-repressible protein n=1 Tax=Sphenostylis stenocarpa TaxID=92480 RepID=A0AA86SB12_9FABA|nr:unnamed protein product [Sphenostylis stenocarpa]
MEKLPRQTEANMLKFWTSRSPTVFRAVSLKTQPHAAQPSHFLTLQTSSSGVSNLQGKGMASTSALSMSLPLTQAAQKRVVPTSEALFKAPLPLRASKGVAVSKPNGRFEVRASMKEKVVTGLTAAALTASMMVPDVAEAAVTPSLKNFLLSIAAGGVVAVAIVGAVIGVANFDPVKRS